MFSQTMLKWKCNLIWTGIFRKHGAKQLKMRFSDLYILLKSALKMQEKKFQTPKIQKFSRRACPQTAIKFSDFAHGWPRSVVRCPVHGNLNCRPPWEMTTLRHWYVTIFSWNRHFVSTILVWICSVRQILSLLNQYRSVQ